MKRAALPGPGSGLARVPAGTAGLRLPVLLLMVACAALALSACASTTRLLGITKPDPLAAQAAAQFAKLQADPQVAKRAPEALLMARKAVDEAQHPSGDAEHAHHLAFVAEKRVQIARALTDASVQHDAYQALVAERDSLGGGNASITTLAQQPVAATPTPQVLTPQALPEPTVVASAEPAETPPELARPEPLQTTPPPPAMPGPGIHGPFTGTHGALLTIEASSFDAHDQLVPKARDAVHKLLPSLAHFPHAKILIRGPVAARVSAVRKELVGLGVPAWRLVEAHDGNNVEIRFNDTSDTP